MFRIHAKKIVFALAACVTLAGCNTTQEQQDQTTGAVVGCAGGAIVGALIGGSRGAAIGCAAGGLIGWGTVRMSQYNAYQARSSSADQNSYRRTDPDFYALNRSGSGSAVKIRGVDASPDRARSGTTIVAVTDYSVVTRGSVNVQESWALKKDGRQLVELKPSPQTRGSGGWESRAEFPVPSDAEPGTYVIEHRVKAGSSYDKQISTFVVRG